MGQKVHPIGFRLAVNRNWNSRWYADHNDFSGMLADDIRVREYLKKKLKNASVGRIVIERPSKNARITIYSARPGVVIGKRGEDIESLKVDDLDIHAYRYVMKPTLPIRRDSPKKAITLILAVLLGGMVGAGIVLGRNALRNYNAK